MKIMRQISAEVTYGNELPYSVSIGGVHGVADSPKGAVIAALSVGRLIPIELRNNGSYQKGAILDFLEMNYDNTPNRNILINTIRRNRIV